jgi:hypothetical protein
LSSRFVVALIVNSFLITALWYLAMRVSPSPEAYFFVLGAVAGF